jgi:hypothetical protein
MPVRMLVVVEVYASSGRSDKALRVCVRAAWYGRARRVCGFRLNLGRSGGHVWT